MFSVYVRAARRRVQTWFSSVRESSTAGNLLLASCLLIAGLLITGLVAVQTHRAQENAVQRERDFGASEIQLNVAARMQACAQILRSGAALFHSSEEVTREDWRTFTEGLQLTKQLPGIQGVGFSLLIPKAQLAAHQAEIRGEGFPDYQVKPEGDRELYSSIIYLEPFRDRNLRAFGYDMYSESVRRVAMDRACDENTVALSGKVTLLQEDGVNVQAGTLMYVPVYRRGMPIETAAERRAALQGWVYSPFRMTDLMGGILHGWERGNTNRRIHLQVYDGEAPSPDTLLYESQHTGVNETYAHTVLAGESVLDVAGRHWTLRFFHHGSPGTVPGHGIVWVVFITGTVISLLLFGLTLNLLNTRARATQIAERLTAKLAESEQSYRNLFSMNSAAMLLVSPDDGAIVDANLAAQSFYGYTREEMLGLHISDINVSPPAEVQSAIRTVQEHEGAKVAFQHRLADGSIRDVEVSSRLIQFGPGRVLNSTIQDVTERKEAEKALRESEYRWKFAVEGSGDGLWDWNVSESTVFFSTRWKEMLGFSEGEIGSGLEEWTQRVHPDDLAKVMADVQSHLAGTTPLYSNEHRVRCKDGTWKWILDRGVVVSRDDAGKPLRLIGSHTDVTDRKRATEALHDSEQRLRSYFNSPTIGIAITSPEKGWLETNVRLCAMLGYSMEELQGGMTWAELTHPDDLAADVEQFGRLLAGEIDDYSMDKRFIRKSGEIIWTRLGVGCVRKSDGIFDYTVATLEDITERKQAEEKLREREAHLRAVIEAIPDLVWLKDADGVYLACNPKFERFFGATESEIVGKTDHDFLDKEQADFFRQKDLVAIAAGASCANEEEVTYADDGHKEIIETVKTPMYDSEGKLVGVLGVGRDITERKRLLDNLDKLSTAVEQSPVSIFMTNLAGEIEYVNPKFTELTGYTAEEVLGQNPRALKSGDKSPEEYRALWTEILAGRPWRGEFCNKKKNEEVLWVRALISPIRNRAGRITHFLAIEEDITASRETEIALRESETRMRAITDAARDAILMMTPDGRISFWNPAAEQILGYTREEALGQILHELIAPERYHAAHHSALPVFVRQGSGGAVGKTLNLEARHKSGAEVPIQLSLSAVQLNGEWHTVGLFRDITEQRRAEEAQILTNRSLAEATARSNELAVRAQSANLAKGEFLANMSHEIRTPMNGVIGITGLLLDTDLNEEQRRYAEIVHASGESLLGLLNDILDFSKIEAGRLDLEVLDFDLSGLLDDFVAALAIRAYEKKLELLYITEPGVPTLLSGDPGRLRQILNNLTGNALKFTEKGDVLIRVETVAEGEADVLLRFSVRDSGIGIPEDKMGLLFDKFSQVDTSTTRLYGGTGLGLAISRQLAQLMGGEIGVESTPGQGSTFWFTARLGKQPASGMKPAVQPAELQDVRALILDDNPTSREILTASLRSWGMRPSTAQDGDGAFASLCDALEEKDPYQIVLVDMSMPGMDGADFGRLVKADARVATTKLVLLTSLGTRGDARRFKEIGFAGYATKPIRNLELRAVLSLAMGGDATGEAGMRALATRHTAREALPSFTDRKARILLAEDNITNQRVALGILKRLGLSADAVANGLEAITALQTLPYDLILMDVQMPELDGIAATERIRNPEFKVPNHAIPIIAMTANALQGDREICLKAGMNDYVSKPVSPAALAAVLDKWLPTDREIIRRDDELKPLENPVTDADRAAAPEVFDRPAVLGRLMNDEELLKTIATCFLDDLPRQMDQLRRCLDVGDVSGAELRAHSIAGASSNLGGEALRAVASAMERAGREGSLEGIQRRMADLENEFERLKQQLNKEL